MYCKKYPYHYQQNTLLINKTTDFPRFFLPQKKIHINLLLNL